MLGTLELFCKQRMGSEQKPVEKKNLWELASANTGFQAQTAVSSLLLIAKSYASWAIIPSECIHSKPSIYLFLWWWSLENA